MLKGIKRGNIQLGISLLYLDSLNSLIIRPFSLLYRKYEMAQPTAYNSNAATSISVFVFNNACIDSIYNGVNRLSFTAEVIIELPIKAGSFLCL